MVWVPSTLKETAGSDRTTLLSYLDEKRIGTRLLFAGNLTKQPAYLNKKFRVSGTLKTTNIVMSNTFWVGIQPALGEEELSYTAKMIKEFL